jgi:putative ABC transport system permease protein
MATLAFKPLSRMAFRNVRKNWRHSLGSLLSIVIGFIAIGLFTGYLDDLEHDQLTSFVDRAMSGDVVVQREGAMSPEGREEPSRFALGEAEQALIDGFLASRAEEVVTRVRVLNVSGLISAGRSGAAFMGIGYDVEEGATLRRSWAWNVRAGKPLHRAGPESIALGKGLGAILDCASAPSGGIYGPRGAPIPEERAFTCRRSRLQVSATTASGQLNVVQPEVVGLFDAGLKALDDTFVHLPLPLAWRLLDTRQVSYYAIRLQRPEEASAFAAALRSAAAERGLRLEAVPWYEHALAELFRRGRDLLRVYRSFVVLIVVTIAGMSVLTTMMKAVAERTREIGTLRSLGFRRWHIVSLFALEAGLLAVMSAVVGLGVTLALTWGINQSGVTYKAGVLSESIRLSVAVVPSAYVFATLFLSGVAMLAALLPASRGARMNITEALGHI